MGGSSAGRLQSRQPGRPGRGAPGLVQATAVVTAIALVVKGLGFVEKLVMASAFGTGIEVDAYLVAYSIPFSAFIVLREVVEPAFLPTFLRTWRASEQDGWRLFGIAATLLLLLLGAVTAAGLLAAEPLIALTAPGFTGEQRALAARLTRLVMPALLFLGLGTLTTATLHAQKRFALPAAAEATFRAGPPTLFLILGRVEGLALGMIAGAFGKLALEALGLGRQLRHARPSLDLTSVPVRTVGRLAAPLLVASSLSLFVGPLVDNAFASQVGVGGVSALAYARKIGETLTTILPYMLGLVLLPFSAEMAARQDHEGLARTLTAVVRALALLFLPVTVSLAILRQPFVQLLFERGAFTAASTQLTAGPLLFYSLGLLPFALEVVVIQFYFARQNTLTPVLADVAAFALNVALIPPLMSFFELGGIALATTVAKTLKVLALLLLWGRQVPAFHLAALGPFAGQMLVASLTTAVVLLTFLPFGQGAADGEGPVGQVAYLAGGGLLGGGTFLLAAGLLRVEEICALWRRAWAWRK